MLYCFGAVLLSGFGTARAQVTERIVLVESTVAKKFTFPDSVKARHADYLARAGWHVEKVGQNQIAFSPSLWASWGSEGRLLVIESALNSKGPIPLTENLAEALRRSQLSSEMPSALSGKTVILGTHLYVGYSVSLGGKEINTGVAGDIEPHIPFEKDRPVPKVEPRFDGCDPLDAGISVRFPLDNDPSNAALTCLPLITPILTQHEVDASERLKKRLRQEFVKRKEEWEAMAGVSKSGQTMKLANLPKAAKDEIKGSLETMARFGKLPAGQTVDQYLAEARVTLRTVSVVRAILIGNCWYGSGELLRQFGSETKKGP